MSILDFKTNPNLTCIEVDNPSFSNTNWITFADPGVTFSSSCSACHVGIENLSQTNFNIYPNPTIGQFNIELYNNDESIISIYSITGKTIFNKQYTSNELIEINLDAPSGLYFVKVETDKGVFTEKIIKQ